MVRRSPPGQANAKRPYSFWYGGQRENVQDRQGPDGFEYGGVYKSDRRRRDLDAHQQPQPPADVLQPGPRRSRPTTSNVYVLGIAPATARPTAARRSSTDAAAGTSTPTSTPCGSTRKDGRHMLLGTRRRDLRRPTTAWPNWDHLNHMAIGQFYHVACRQPPSRTASTAACRTTAAGAARADTLDGARPGQRGLGHASAAATASSAASIRTTPTSSTPRARTATWAGATSAPASARRIRPAAPSRASRRTASTGTRRSSCRSHNRSIFYCGGNYVFRSLEQGDDPQGDLARNSRGPKRGTATAPGRVAAQPRRALGRHRRRQPVGDAGRRQEVDQRRREGRAAGAALGGDASRRRATSRGVPTSCFDAHRSDDDEPLRLRHRGLRPDLEAAARQPADGLDARACART